ncbi:MAG: DUF3021 family protein [Oscillospiraceae bacterium]|nr:DUF3021 family protein [Oscillospiraceae bacterium]
MDIREFARDAVSTFFVIFTCCVLAGFVWLHVWGNEGLPASDVVAMLVMSLLGALSGIVLYSNRAMKMRELVIRHAVHLCLVMGIGLSVASFMRWVSWDVPITVIGFIGLIAGGYILVSLVEYFKCKKTMDELNRKLQERNNSEQPTA